MLDTIEKMLSHINPGTPMKVKQEVLDYLMRKPDQLKKYVDFRTVKTAIEMRVAFPDRWKKLLDKTILHSSKKR